MITIIPAIDIIGGKCVRLTQGEYDSVKTYHNDPLEVAKDFESHGIKRLHLVDLDGAKQKKVVNQKVLERITSGTNLVVDFGGGIKKEEDLKSIFNAGAAYAVVGSMAVTNNEIFRKWINDFGGEKFILAADVLNKKIAISGWMESTAIDLMEFLRQQITNGVKKVLCTDISKDGMLQGTSVDLYKEIKETYPELYLIASGGVTDESDITALIDYNIDGVIIGKAIYEGKLRLSKLLKFI
ncbi:MAG: 1-(5-phosphoribosyl)-5-[(5-phosphoribosylamino)methylideneamino]imidazole-4-carboxamide isomerase [Bacteroidales bacterium]|nr:1-(5-phosphoribosyl)-5-[(5-phosphoribosylamino)methylideneamino]imidazole-4-carboxamide isomerase [Bacteroidales bacterium]